MSIQKSRSSRGFTLLEIMIVILIVGVLSGVAIQAYGNYLARTWMTDVLTSLRQASFAVSEFVAVNGRAPTYSEVGLVQGWDDVRTQASTGQSGLKGVGCGIGTPRENDCYTLEAWIDSKRIPWVLSQQGASWAGENRILLMEAQMNNNGILIWTCRLHPAWGLAAKFLPASCR